MASPGEGCRLPRYVMSVTTVAVLLILVAAPVVAVPTWRPLFNGHSLAGWQHVGPGSMTVKDGLITTQGGMGLLYWTGGPVGDCEIRVVYRITGQSSNSGVFIRIPLQPREEWMPVHYGYEVQIDSAEDAFHRTGTLYSFTRALSTPELPAPAWNEMLIRIQGARTTVVVNGTLVTDFLDSSAVQATVPERASEWEPQRGVRPSSGWFGLQNHSDKDVVYFKEISIRSLQHTH